MPNPLRPLLLASCLALAVVAARPARAEEPAAQAREAAAIGRDLLSTDAEVRTRAVERLLARIERGGDLEAFLRAMSEEARTWADRRERLMDLWLHQAVHGSAAEREEAVGLLAALGTDAVRRLALELRHARGMARSEASPSDPPAAPSASGAEPPPPEAPAGTPRIYDVRDLLEHGMNALQIRSLLQKTPDAVEVKTLQSGLYLVTAEDEGHTALRIRLEDLRTSAQSLDEALTAADPPPATPGQAEGTASSIPTGPPVQVAAPLAAAKTEAPAADVQGDSAPDVRAWQVHSVIYHVPTAALASRGAYATGLEPSGSLPGGLAADRTDVHVGTSADVSAWARVLQRLPDATQAPEVQGAQTLRAGVATMLFSGTRHSYARSMTATKGGAWKVVMDTIPHGLGLEIHATPSGSEVEISVVASRTDVGQPIPVVEVRPAPDAAPVHLERPEWSTTRARTRFTVPATGGGAFLSLGGLGSSDQDHIIVLLRIERPGPRR